MWKPRPRDVRVAPHDSHFSNMALLREGLSAWDNGRGRQLKANSLTCFVYHKKMAIMKNIARDYDGDEWVHYMWFDVCDIWSYDEIIASCVRISAHGRSLEFGVIERTTGERECLGHYLGTEEFPFWNKALRTHTTSTHINDTQLALHGSLEPTAPLFKGPVPASSEEFDVDLPGLHKDMTVMVDYAGPVLANNLEAGRFKNSGAIKEAFKLYANLTETQQSIRDLKKTFEEMSYDKPNLPRENVTGA